MNFNYYYFVYFSQFQILDLEPNFDFDRLSLIRSILRISWCYEVLAEHFQDQNKAELIKPMKSSPNKPRPWEHLANLESFLNVT